MLEDLIEVFELSLDFVKSCWPLALILVALETASDYLLTLETLNVDGLIAALLAGSAISVVSTTLTYLWCARHWRGRGLKNTALPGPQTLACFAPVALYAIAISAVGVLLGGTLPFLEDFGILALLLLISAAIALLVVMVLATFGLAPWIVGRANAEAITIRQSFNLMDGYKLEMFGAVFCLGFIAKAITLLQFALPDRAAPIVNGGSYALALISYVALCDIYYRRGHGAMPVDKEGAIHNA